MYLWLEDDNAIGPNHSDLFGQHSRAGPNKIDQLHQQLRSLHRRRSNVVATSTCAYMHSYSRREAWGCLKRSSSLYWGMV